jgi:hypothetical protein
VTAGGMRFSVDGWDPGYGSSVDVEDDDLGESSAPVEVNVELPAGQWRAIDPDLALPRPAALMFVDGVRRVEARVWIENDAASAAREATAALCASYAAGVVRCCGSQAELVFTETRRGLFTIAPHAADITTWAGRYAACRVPPPARGKPLSMTLSQALQNRLAEVEAAAAKEAVARLSLPPEADLLVVDGPLRRGQHLPRTLGYIKSHRSTYLAPEQNALVSELAPGQRTPIFRMGSSWVRHTWYLRLPGAAGAPWAGVVRVECSADLPVPQVIELAGLSQLCLGRFASTQYKDGRAPQNLYPISGLERELRRRLGDAKLLYRALRRSAVT